MSFSLYPLALAVLAAAGVVIQVASAENAAAVRRLFSYYTIHTNILVAAVMLLRFWRGEIAPTPWLEGLTVGVTIWIMVTALVYHFLLARLHNPTGAKAVANVLLHYAAPFGTLAYFLLTPGSGGRMMLLWVLYPLAYTAFALIRGRIDGFYPYWFLRPDGQYPEGNGSYWRVAAFVSGAGAVLLLLGNGLWYLRMLLHR